MTRLKDTPAPLPASGGSYTRNPDGSLSPVSQEPTATPPAPAPKPQKPAVKEA